VYLSLQIKEMEKSINGEDLNLIERRKIVPN